MKRLKRLLLVVFLFTGVANAQQDSMHKNLDGIFGSAKLQPYRQRANEYLSSFKNRYALDELKKMDAAADTIAAADMQKAESELKHKQEAETKEQVLKINEQNTLIKSLEEQNKVLRDERNKLWKKAIISILVWLLLVVLFVTYRMRMFAKANKTLVQSGKALVNAEKFYNKGDRLIKRITANQSILKEASAACERLTTELKQPSSTSRNISDLLMPVTEQINGTLALDDLLLLISGELNEEKKAIDINGLCEQMVLFGNKGILTEDDSLYNFTITKDLEKKLPQVRMNEQGLARMMLFLISNALNACYRQSQKVVKGYQPKITLSTRVLPRFVQIKVKDNGAGVSDAIMDNIYEPFFTAENGNRAGLGLTLSKKIIEQNKGELKIESSLDRGTDVTIKLFLESK